MVGQVRTAEARIVPALAADGKFRGGAVHSHGAGAEVHPLPEEKAIIGDSQALDVVVLQQTIEGLGIRGHQTDVVRDVRVALDSFGPVAVQDPLEFLSAHVGVRGTTRVVDGPPRSLPPAKISATRSSIFSLGCTGRTSTLPALPAPPPGSRVSTARLLLGRSDPRPCPPWVTSVDTDATMVDLSTYWRECTPICSNACTGGSPFGKLTSRWCVPESARGAKLAAKGMLPSIKLIADPISSPDVGSL